MASHGEEDITLTPVSGNSRTLKLNCVPNWFSRLDISTDSEHSSHADAEKSLKSHFTLHCLPLHCTVILAKNVIFFCCKLIKN